MAKTKDDVYKLFNEALTDEHREYGLRMCLRLFKEEYPMFPDNVSKFTKRAQEEGGTVYLSMENKGQGWLFVDAWSIERIIRLMHQFQINYKGTETHVLQATATQAVIKMIFTFEPYASPVSVLRAIEEPNTLLSEDYKAKEESVENKEYPPDYYCDECPHARHLHNPDGSCPCGIDCANRRMNKAKQDDKSMPDAN